MSLSELIYEHVNEDYSLGKYGEFRILIRNRDGYVNVTKLCEDEGKDFHSWTRLDYTESLIDTLKLYLQCNTQILEVFKTFSKHELSGTYAHPLLVPHIASWISPVFAITVSEIVNDHLVNKRIDKLLDEVKNQTKTIHNQSSEISELKTMLKTQQRTLQVLNENVFALITRVFLTNTPRRN